MDKNTTGLLVFTNDTDMKIYFAKPKNHLKSKVSLDKNLKFEDLKNQQRACS
jgi:23S rRNA pseudouridine2605 synthase